MAVKTYNGPVRGGHSPWGPIQGVTLMAEGIWSIDTASHGGIKLSPKRNRLIPEYMRQKGGWYEEDCDWCIPVVVFKDELARDYEQAVETFKNWRPGMYERFFGVQLKEGESFIRDQEINDLRNFNNFVVKAAWGDWHEGVYDGFVAVAARKESTGEERFFLVPQDEYRARDHKFVIDPSRHAEIPPIR